MRTVGTTLNDVSYIYSDKDIRDLDTSGAGTGSAAYITWDLDDGKIVYDPLTTAPGTFDVFTYRVTVEGAPSNMALVIVRIDEPTEVIDLIFEDSFEE